MLYQPDFSAFQSGAEKGNLIPVCREILGDMETPVSAFYKLARDKEHAFLLESAEGGEHWGRYSFIGIKADKVFSSRGNRVEICEGKDRRHFKEVNPLSKLQELMNCYRPVACDDLPGRFLGGGVGYIGYDAVRFIEDLPDNLPDELQLPDIKLLFCKTVLIFDNLTSKIKIVSNVALGGNEDLKQAYDEAVKDIEEVI
ncbi:MAG: anthranilate synthase component I, partial [bacterium]